MTKLIRLIIRLIGFGKIADTDGIVTELRQLQSDDLSITKMKLW